MSKNVKFIMKKAIFKYVQYIFHETTSSLEDDSKINFYISQNKKISPQWRCAKTVNNLFNQIENLGQN
jgi:hypothetical protein